jgi:hypothetical protein
MSYTEVCGEFSLQSSNFNAFRRPFIARRIARQRIENPTRLNMIGLRFFSKASPYVPLIEFTTIILACIAEKKIHMHPDVPHSGLDHKKL